MTALSQTIHILILTSRAEEAERLVTSLRNGGLAVRGIYTHQAERIEELIDARPCEIILCCVYDPNVVLQSVLARYNDLDRDIPLIMVADGESDPDVLIQALRAGARDLTERDDVEHLQLVIAREIEDLHKRRALVQLRDRLEQCESRAKEQVESSAEAVAFIQEGVHVHVNPAYQQIFGFDDADDLDGYPLLDMVAPEQHQVIRLLLRGQAQHPEAIATEIEAECIRADESRFGATLSISSAEQDGEPCLRVAVHALVAIGSQPAVAAETAAGGLDTDTGLPDRTTFLAALAQRLAESVDPQRPLVLLYVGIRRFDELLATEGLTPTLELAAAFATSLRAVVPEPHYLARIGERGFVVMAEDLDSDATERLAAAIRDGARLSLPVRAADGPDCDIGWLLADTSQSSASELLDAAFRHYLDQRVPAKIETAAPPSAAPVIDPMSELEMEIMPAAPPATAAMPPADADADHTEDEAIAEQIDHALQSDRFKLVYQPIVSLMGDQQENYSVLLRMLDDEQNLREAKELIGPAVRTGRMAALNRWIVRRAIEEVTRHRKDGQKVNLFINLSQNTYTEESLLIYICDCIREFEARGSWLTFQFKEEQMHHHLAELDKLVEGLKKIQCRIAVSHFGIIEKPDAILQSLPVDLVLFYPDLSHDLAEDRNKQRRLQQLTKLAHEFNVKSVVTGVEDARSLTVLWTSGIDYVQGNFLQRPSPTLALEE